MSEMGSMIGQTVSRNKLIRRSGEAAWVSSTRWKTVVLVRHVALKFPPEMMAHDAQVLERFRPEARTASALNRPKICTFS
jgi:hypothetical protein